MVFPDLFVREALARLRDDGLIVSRRGSGSFVKKRPAGAVLAFPPLCGSNSLSNLAVHSCRWPKNIEPWINKRRLDQSDAAA
jgi:GntR family transcriptional repressor for pyruvate dehydrogenase complex